MKKFYLLTNSRTYLKTKQKKTISQSKRKKYHSKFLSNNLYVHFDVRLFLWNMIGQHTPYCHLLSSPWPSEPPIPLLSKPGEMIVDTLCTPACIECTPKTPPTPKAVDNVSQEEFSLSESPTQLDLDTPTTQISPLHTTSISPSTANPSFQIPPSPKTKYVITSSPRQKPHRSVSSTARHPITIASFGKISEWWRRDAQIPIRNTATYELRKRHNAYCGIRRYKSPPKRQIDYKNPPKPTIRQTKGTDLRLRKNKERVRRIINNEDKRPPFR